MIKINRLTVLLGGILAMSCDPSKVDLPPIAPTELQYFRNNDEFRTALVGVYADIYDDYHFAATGYNGWVHSTWLLPGDDLTENNGARTAEELFDGTLNPGNGRVQFVFTSAYKGIARANVVIEKVRTLDIPSLRGADEIAKMEGEALFLRGYQYFKLFNIFGSVPLITERIKSQAESNKPKSAALDILSQVIDDARTAISSLPDQWDAQWAGRVTKNSARGLLVKALVFRGNYTGNAADYTEALTVFNSITATLVPDYLDNFRATTENNAESLYELQATVAGGGIANLQLAHDGAWRGVENMTVYRGPMMEFLGKGDFNDASPTKFMITEKLLNGFRDDPRISVFLNSEDGYNGRIFQKYNKPNGTNDLRPGQGGSVNNERILRYADVKLIAAEAAVRTGNLAAAVAHLNDVRARARAWAKTGEFGNGTLPADHPAGTDQAEVLKWVMDERFVELAGEGHRWWDLKRWHASGAINLSGWGGGSEHFSTMLASPVQFDVAKHLVFPIPQTEITRNSAILENNPGYN